MTDTLTPLNTLGSRIQSRLDALGLTPSSAAEIAGLDRSAIRFMVSGRSEKPRMDTVLKVCRVLQCSLDYLFGLDLEPGTTPATEATASTRPVVDRDLLRRIGNAVEKRRTKFNLTLGESVTEETLEHYDALVAETDMSDPEEIDLRVRLLEKNFSKKDF